MKKSFYNHPDYMDISEYSSAKEDIIRCFSISEDIKAILEYGSLKNIGISDLDIIVVLDNNIHKDCCKLISKNRLSPQTLKVIDYANIIILPEKKINRLLIWDDLNLNQIYGNYLKIEKFNQIEVEIARIIDWLPERIIRIEETISNPKINVRKSLGLLKSSCYTLSNLIDKFNLEVNSFRYLINQVNNLRQEWFYIEKKESESLILNLLNETKQNLLIGLNLFDEWLDDFFKPKYKESTFNAILKFPNNSSYIFNNKINKRISIGNDKTINLNLSTYYFLHFHNYALEDGLISKKIKDNFYVNIIKNNFLLLPNKYNKILKERIALCNMWANFLSNSNFKSGLFKMGWFYNN